MFVCVCVCGGGGHALPSSYRATPELPCVVYLHGNSSCRLAVRALLGTRAWRPSGAERGGGAGGGAAAGGGGPARAGRDGRGGTQAVVDCASACV